VSDAQPPVYAEKDKQPAPLQTEAAVIGGETVASPATVSAPQSAIAEMTPAVSATETAPPMHASPVAEKAPVSLDTPAHTNATQAPPVAEKASSKE